MDMSVGHRAVRVVLAHGASGTAASMRPYVDGLRARGVEAVAIDLPKRKAEDAVPAYLAALTGVTPMPGGARLIIGGQSYGGRVASLLCAGVNVPAGSMPDLAGLVCFCYPLHLPGKPERGLRSEHWPQIALPTLILQGESDPFARIGLLRGELPRLADGRLQTWPGIGHGLGPVLDEALDAVVTWLDEVVLAP
ncbi:MAG: alpha/beta family hydrolase [Candidatus Limnocylindrales bacterium]|jgi:hypothetical protein